jgi:hypothetical protein
MLRTSRFLTGLVTVFAWTGVALAQVQAAATYIVQSETLEAARSHVRRIGAEPARDFEIIHAVEVQLTAEQAARLRANARVRVFDDRAITTRGARGDRS